MRKNYKRITSDSKEYSEEMHIKARTAAKNQIDNSQAILLVTVNKEDGCTQVMCCVSPADILRIGPKMSEIDRMMKDEFVESFKEYNEKG